MLRKAEIDPKGFNKDIELPYELRLKDFEIAMQDIYDFLHDINEYLLNKGLSRMDDMLRPQTMSGVLSDMLTDSLGTHARSLVVNTYHNGHPDLVVKGRYPDNKVKAGTDGVEVKTTLKKGGAVDTHGGRDQYLCVFVYQVDKQTEPANDRAPMQFTELYLGYVAASEFRRNERSDLGTRTATLAREGIKKFRESWVYKAEFT